MAQGSLVHCCPHSMDLPVPGSSQRVSSLASHSYPAAQHTQTERWDHTTAAPVARWDHNDRSVVVVEEVEKASVGPVAEELASAHGSTERLPVVPGVR